MARESSPKRPTPRAPAGDVPAGIATQLQQIGEQALESFRAEARLQAEEVGEARTAGEVAGLQMAFAASQFGHFARLGERMLELAFDAQRQWLCAFESQCAQMLQPWLGRGDGLATPSMQAMLAPAIDLTPAGVLGNAQRVWSEAAKVWLDAITHDLQQAQPAR